MATLLQKIVPHLWYDTQAKEAAEFYVSVFPGSRMISSVVLENTPSGNVETVVFELSGQRFVAISAGPLFQFNESISFMVSCDTQEEINYYWEKLSEGGDPSAQQCGWLKDKFGLSWQVTPTVMNEMMTSGTKEQIARVTQAFLTMKKFDIAALQKAFKG
jgi:predicted 3-demethylubiquinone-9 3-methyltransferase (glyoxalase superfamily)